MFYTAQKGIVEIKSTPVVRGRILGASGNLMFLAYQSYPYVGPSRLEIDALRLGDDVTLEMHYTVLLPGVKEFDCATLSPDGRWLIVKGRVDRPTVGFTGRFPFIFPYPSRDEVFLAVNLESSTTIKILKRINTSGYKYSAHTPRWLPDGKSVCIVLDGELRVWKLFD